MRKYKVIFRKGKTEGFLIIPAENYISACKFADKKFKVKVIDVVPLV